MVVDEDAVRQRARDYLAAFRSRWPRTDVAFASKAFPCTAIQRLVSEEGLLLDVAGGGEIITALAAGADPARMLLHGNAKTDEELELAVAQGRRPGRRRQLRRHRPAGAHRRAGPPAGLPGAGDPRYRGRHPRRDRDRARRLEVRSAARGRAAWRSTGSGAAGCCAATACTPTSAPSCSTPSSWRPPWRRSPSSAASTSTTSAAGSASATPTPITRPRSTTTRRP